jgi:ribulose-bisphosphate carboxylase small chain
MRVTQGTFSFLPDLDDEQIRRQVEYILGNGWAVSIESTDDIHPRNVYWDMWGQPMFDATSAAAVLREVEACRVAHPDRYVKVNAFDATACWETMRLSFLVWRPPEEPGLGLQRQAGPGRSQRYTVAAYATGRPAGRRYPRGEP